MKSVNLNRQETPVCNDRSSPDQTKIIMEET